MCPQHHEISHLLGCGDPLQLEFPPNVLERFFSLVPIEFLGVVVKMVVQMARERVEVMETTGLDLRDG